MLYKNSNKILEQLEKKFGIKVGETTKDNLLSLLSARCVGSCSLAPIAIYDKKTVGHLSLEESVKKHRS
nr:NAD(P)H-dependent oxidoreductase subunit E [Halarcobacter anaerophilus]